MEFKKVVEQIKTVSPTSWSYWGNALAGETGELCNIIKKMERDNKQLNADDKKELISKMGLELADIFIYCELIAKSFKIDFEKKIQLKLYMLQIQEIIQNEDRGMGVSHAYLYQEANIDSWELTEALHALLKNDKIYVNVAYPESLYKVRTQRDFGTL